MKILLALDSAAASEAIVNEVAARPWPPGSAARLLHVLDLFTIPAGIPVIGPESEPTGHPIEPLLKSAAERFSAQGIETLTEIVEGYPPSMIVEYADRWGADFIIVGSHGDGDITRFLLGSVAREVVRRASCSVEIVRPTGRKDGGMKILLATDGSESSLQAAQSIAERPWPAGSEVKVVSVVHLVLSAIESWPGAPEIISRFKKEGTAQAEEAVAAAEKIISEAELQTTGATLTGSPKACIVDEAKEWGANLVVVGSHGRRGVTKLFMGGVSEAVAMHAHCSVDVIRTTK
jgi:nucleotide-binding universal stress UspA family protein